MGTTIHSGRVFPTFVVSDLQFDTYYYQDLQSVSVLIILIIM
jgi:hypothetical protein